MTRMNIPAHMRDNHVTARMGTINLIVMARWCVKTRSKRGAVTMAATIPESRRHAPIIPLRSEE